MITGPQHLSVPEPLKILYEYIDKLNDLYQNVRDQMVSLRTQRVSLKAVFKEHADVAQGIIDKALDDFKQGKDWLSLKNGFRNNNDGLADHAMMVETLMLAPSLPRIVYQGKTQSLLDVFKSHHKTLRKASKAANELAQEPGNKDLALRWYAARYPAKT